MNILSPGINITVSVFFCFVIRLLGQVDKIEPGETFSH